jgi:hypothetical protein
MKTAQRYLLFIVIGLAVFVLLFSFSLTPSINLPSSVDERTALFHLRLRQYSEQPYHNFSQNNTNSYSDSNSRSNSHASPINSTERPPQLPQQSFSRRVVEWSRQVGTTTGNFFSSIGSPSTKTSQSSQVKNSFETDPGKDCAGKPLPVPKCAIYAYIQYWSTLYSKGDCYESPLRPTPSPSISEETGLNGTPWDRQKYVVFEPDRGGWNNIRMAAETAIIFAHATGRTLVMPTPMKFYLLGQNRKRQKSRQLDDTSTISMFLNVDSLSDSLSVISMEDFLENVAKIPGFLPVSLLPDQSIPEIIKQSKSSSSAGDDVFIPSTLSQYLHSACYHENWQPGNQFIGLNIRRSSGKAIFSPLNRSMENERFRTMVATGRQVHEYDEEFHAHQCIFFPSGLQNSKQRLLTHFYSYLYFEDPLLERVYRRMVRDRLRYQDKILCIAGMIVQELHTESAALTGHGLPRKDVIGGNTSDGSATYFSLHYRQHSFQPELYPTPEQVYTHSFHLFDPKVSRLVYVATDARDRKMFHGFSQPPAKFQVRFFHDFFSEAHVEDLFQEPFNYNLVGMIEQIVCANAHTFVGSPFSTFTGYITRLRGKRLNRIWMLKCPD